MRPGGASLILTAAALACVAGPRTLAAQRSEPRSRDYLFITNVDDARATWVNPAGLGWIPEASVLGEVLLDRSSGTLRMTQYTVGLNSRGLGLSYMRDRSRDTVSVGVVRLALGVPLGAGTMGAGYAMYSQTHDQGFDLGLRYPVFAGLDVGVVVRDISRPQPAAAEPLKPVTTVAGATWAVVPREVTVSGEAIAVERPGPTSGFDWAYRGGFTIRTNRPWPVALVAAAQVDQQGSLRQWSLGLVIGRLDRVGVVAGALPTTVLGSVDRFSAVGVASRRATAP
jgi:hypothetical protein